jgi:hypothetical protein
MLRVGSQAGSWRALRRRLLVGLLFSFFLVIMAFFRALHHLASAQALNSSLSRALEAGLDEAAAWRDKADATRTTLEGVRSALEAAERTAETLQTMRQEAKARLRECEAARDALKTNIEVLSKGRRAAVEPTSENSEVPPAGDAGAVAVSELKREQQSRASSEPTAVGGGGVASGESLLLSSSPPNDGEPAPMVGDGQLVSEKLEPQAAGESPTPRGGGVDALLNAKREPNPISAEGLGLLS